MSETSHRRKIAVQPTENVTIGGVTQRLDDLEPFVADYLSGNHRWAYPAYDTYHQAQTHHVEEPDLLAICLLNAGSKPIASYYTLQAFMPRMNEILAQLDPSERLETATEQTLDLIADFFGILDHAESTTQVGKTKLLKVLHRKRPHLIPLFDENIRRCYSVLGTQLIPEDKQRSHRDFAKVWLPAVQHDLTSQLHVWDAICAKALPEAPISRLRALDIIGWKLGRKPRRQNTLDTRSAL